MALHGRRALGLLLLLTLSGLICIATFSSAALAGDPATPELTVRMLDAEGHTDTLAGSHPDRLRMSFALSEGSSVRDLEIELPPGLTGSATAVPQCPRAVVENEEECGPESQVGQLEITLSGGSKADLPLFALEPKPGEILAIGSRPGVNVPLESRMRATDFGITLTGNEVPQGSLTEATLELWGVPADHQEGTEIPRRPFLTAPAVCGPVKFKFRARTWEEGAEWVNTEADTGTPLTGCEELSFEPSLGFQLSEPAADSPTGLRVDLNVPGAAEGSERESAPSRNVNIEFPSGIAISPGGAEGVVACSDARFGQGDGAPPQCPARSQVGTVDLTSDALGGALKGAIYIGEGNPGERLRSLVAIAAPGATLKFVSAMQIDPATGRLSTTMRDLPPMPIQQISLNFASGSRALFATPLECGRVSAKALFEPYGGGRSVQSTAPVSIQPLSHGAPCTPPGFSPQLVTESSVHKTGQPTVLSTTLLRNPGEQLPRGFSMTFPSGMSARLGAVSPCAAPAVASPGACSPASLIGSAQAKIGSGADPATLHGDVYLTGPYRRAPFGLLMEFQGSLGPFSLGAITTRSALETNPRNGRITAVTKDIPERVEGLPIRFQSIELSLDRPGFIRNPTSCSSVSTNAAFESQSGAVAHANSALELHGCKSLRFAPRVRLAILGRGEGRVHGTPILRVSTGLRSGGSNLRAMKLLLPPVLKFRTGKLGEICSQQDADGGDCPADSRIGTAFGRTAVLSAPLHGSIYMVQPKGDDLPDLWVSMEGAGVQVALRGHTHTTKSGRLVTALSGLPDTPLTSFTMRIGGRKTQVISLQADPCARGESRHFVATVDATAQNGARRSLRAPIGAGAVCAESAR